MRKNEWGDEYPSPPSDLLTIDRCFISQVICDAPIERAYDSALEILFPLLRPKYHPTAWNNLVDQGKVILITPLRQYSPPFATNASQIMDSLVERTLEAVQSFMRLSDYDCVDVDGWRCKEWRRIGQNVGYIRQYGAISKLELLESFAYLDDWHDTRRPVCIITNIDDAFKDPGEFQRIWTLIQALVQLVIHKLKGKLLFYTTRTLLLQSMMQAEDRKFIRGDLKVD
ncbi:hypothetical protein GGR57DRAFT_502710 [Xylariaceae sp. FL1272]|nr:hypothetical protein GGR57DRAFT_502710 [Xylariaceae sp. FL1272]